MIYYGKELYHFGIHGMRWGVRRYQNEDGSLTPEGKRRYAKEVKKTGSLNLKDVYKNNQYLKKDIDALKKAKQNERKLFDDAEKAENDLYSSDARKRVSEKAYKETEKYFKKYEPDSYDYMKKNSDDLMDFHDFRKLYEGNEDYYMQKDKSYSSVRKKYDKWEKASNTSREAADKIIDDLIGKHNSVKLDRDFYRKIYQELDELD